MRSPWSGSASRYARIGSVSVWPGSTALTRMPWRRVLLRDLLREPEHTVLRRGVLRLARRGHDARGRRDVDDRATAALRDDLPQLVLHAEEHAGEIDVDRALPLGERVLDERLRRRARCRRCCTAQSRPPKRSTAVCTIARDRRRRRRRRPRPRPRCPRSRAWCPSPRPRRCRRRRRSRPAGANSCAIARPMPLPAPVTSATLPGEGHRLRRCEIRRRCARPDRSPRSGSHVASASTASTIVSIGSTISSGRSIIAVAPSVRTAARGRDRVHRDARRRAARSRTTSSAGRARPCSARTSTSAPAAGCRPGSTIALVMFTIQPAPRSRIPGTTAFVRRYGVITFTSYATRSRRSEVSSIER